MASIFILHHPAQSPGILPAGTIYTFTVCRCKSLTKPSGWINLMRFSKKKRKIVRQRTKRNPADIVINTEDIMKRLERVGPGFGDQRSPFVIQKGDKTLVYFASNYVE